MRKSVRESVNNFFQRLCMTQNSRKHVSISILIVWFQYQSSSKSATPDGPQQECNRDAKANRGPYRNKYIYVYIYIYICRKMSNPTLHTDYGDHQDNPSGTAGRCATNTLGRGHKSPLSVNALALFNCSRKCGRPPCASLLEELCIRLAKLRQIE